MDTREIVFEQDRKFSATVFVLSEKHVQIKGLLAASLQMIPYKKIDPECKQAKHIVIRAALVPAILLIISLAGAIKMEHLSNKDLIPRGLIVVPIVLAASFAAYTLTGLMPIDTVIYYDTNGKLLFELYRTKRKRFRLDDFVGELNRRLVTSAGRRIVADPLPETDL